MGDDEKDTGEPTGLRKVAATGRRLNRHPTLVAATQRLRKLLPGDDRFGDPLSFDGPSGPSLVGRRFAELSSERPGMLGEAGLGALQVWQAIGEAQGRGRGDMDLAIVFTDMIGFSDFALAAGDDAALELLRDVAEAIEPPVKESGGEVVKRLGDGMMAVFDHPADGLDAVLAARDRLAAVGAPDYEPQIRAGMHFGRPRKVGGDYLGVDVNIAARVADDAGANEVLVSDRALDELDRDALKVKKRWSFRAKGVPKDVTVYAVRPAT